MKKLNGKFKFKTEKQLLSTGWKPMGDDLLHHKDTYAVTRRMLSQLSGEIISISDGLHSKGKWLITSEMVLNESQEIQEILNRYEDA